MKKIGYVFVLLLLFFATDGFSHSTGRGMRGGMTGGMSMINSGGGMAQMRMIMKYAEKIGLSDQQIGKIKNLRIDGMKENIKLTAKIKIADLEKAEILAVPVKNIDEKKLAAKMDEISGFYKQQELNKIKCEKAVLSVLTKDQIKNLKKLNLNDNNEKGNNNDMPIMMRR